MSEQLLPFEQELLQIIESDLSDKKVHVNRLASFYGDHKEEILSSFQIWQDLKSIETPTVSAKTDLAFYKMLSQEELGGVQDAPVIQMKEKKTKTSWLAPWKLAVAATFLLGLFLGQFLNFSQQTTVIPEEKFPGQIQFASLESTPQASDRIKGITQVKGEESPDMVILESLKQVILNDPNINVRLTAIETLVLFSDIPEARQILIQAIPYQTSPTVQLELADIMLSLEEKQSADAWEQLLSSDHVETDVKINLQHALKRIF